MDRPYMLSIHPTMQCDYDCFGCYLKKDIVNGREEREPAFFLKLIEKAKEIGMKEVSCPINYVKRDPNFTFLEDPSPVWDKVDRNIYFFKWMKDKCAEFGLDFSTYVNYDAITSYRDVLDFKDISLMGISINDFVTKTPEKRKSALDLFREMRNNGVKRLNCNVLLTDRMVTDLENGLAEEILEVADTIYLLMSQPLFVPLETIYKRIRGLPNLMTMLDERVFLDSCITREMGMTNGKCSRHDMIYVNPYGEIKKCYYDKKDLFVLKTADDLEHVYKNLHPQPTLVTCDLVTHGDKLKAERDARKAKK